MPSTRKFITTEPQGVAFGTFWDDRSLIQHLETAAITRIQVGHGTYIMSLTVHYGHEISTVQHGVTDTTTAEIVLEAGEFITKIHGEAIPDWKCIARITFTTNKGMTWGPYGERSGTKSFVWDVSTMVGSELAPRMGLLYFSGSHKSCISHLQATFALYRGLDESPRVVTYEPEALEGGDLQSIKLSTFARNLMSPTVTVCVAEQGIEFHVYEDTLCQLPFFRAALKGGFKEASEKRIRMPEDEPDIVSALIEFMSLGTYTYNYNPDSSPMGEDGTPTISLREGSFHVRLYALASKYDCQPLARVAINGLTYVINALKGLDVIQLLKEAYDEGWVVSEWENSVDMLDVKHGLPGLLKELYANHREDMRNLVSGHPALVDELLRLVVSE